MEAKQKQWGFKASYLNIKKRTKQKYKIGRKSF